MVIESSEETSFQIAVAWLLKWSESKGEVLQWAAHKMTSHNYIYLWRGRIGQ